MRPTSALLPVLLLVIGTACATGGAGRVITEAERTELVTQVQTRLREAGVYPGEPDGRLDGSLQNALLAYQEQQGLRTTGRMDRFTAESLGVSFAAWQAAEAGRIATAAQVAKAAESAPDSDRDEERLYRTVLNLQRALRERGHYAAEPEGVWNAATTSALRAFQRQAALPVTGRVDRFTADELGVDAETAQRAEHWRPSTAFLGQLAAPTPTPLPTLGPAATPSPSPTPSPTPKPPAQKATPKPTPFPTPSPAPYPTLFPTQTPQAAAPEPRAWPTPRVTAPQPEPAPAPEADVPVFFDESLPMAPLPD